MSEANKRVRTCFHESAHAIMAHIEGIPISQIKLLSVEENAQLSGHILMSIPEGQWTTSLVVSHIRVSMAGPHGEDFGPAPGNSVERHFRSWEKDQHAQKAFQLIQQFLLGRRVQGDEEITNAAELLASAEQDVRDVFNRSEIRSCLKSLASELKERGELAGSEIAQLVESRITDAQLQTIRAECLLTTFNPNCELHHG